VPADESEPRPGFLTVNGGDEPCHVLGLPPPVEEVLDRGSPIGADIGDELTPTRQLLVADLAYVDHGA
jgi:hypothetical protein